VTDKQTDFTADEMMKLKRRVDIIPPSLALVQAAIESGWGSSRFAREGNALFGQWTTGEGLKAQGSDARLAAFATPTKSVAAYCLNLNTHRSYTQFRHARAEMRQKGTTIDGVNLAGYLDRYSEKGEAYTRLIKDMIQRDGLEIADTAQLSKGPDIIIRPVGP
jgi:Bax protein